MSSVYSAFDSTFYPTLPGGAGWYQAPDGPGGGVIALTASYLHLDGDIIADGGDSNFVSQGAGGAGEIYFHLLGKLRSNFFNI